MSYLFTPTQKVIKHIVLFFAYWAAWSASQAQNCMDGSNMKALAVDWAYGTTFVTDDVGFVAANGSIRKTIDGGNSWITCKLPKGLAGNFRHFYFTDLSTGWVCVANGLIGKTTDAGETWTLQNSNNTIFLRYIYGSSPTDIWSVGYEATVLHTTDGGDTWIKESIPAIAPNFTGYFNCVYFIKDTKVGFIGGQKGHLLKTTDQGKTWRKVLPANDTITSVDAVTFYNEKLGFAVGDSGLIMRTDDGGENWTKLNGVSKGRLRGVHFVTPLVGYATGAPGVIQTLDGGITWHRRVPNISTDFFDLHFPSSNVGYAAGGRNQFIRITTTNPPPPANFIITSDSVLIANASPGYQYQWYLGNDSIPGANAGIHTAQVNGPYKVKVSYHDCATVSEPQFVTGIKSTVGIGQTIAKQALRLSPNPAQGQATLSLPFASNRLQIKLINQWGQLVGQSNFDSPQQVVQFSTLHLPAGMYMVKVQTDQGVFQNKLIINP